ncbi:LytTR family DNA-binding domain-containing protein [Fluviicola sp.]|uniref:LytR/AlgR family response regulator transcription factor n=1 Tax=Fluviicola sp. TaxID=1917219 RepID=UPI0031DA331A
MNFLNKQIHFTVSGRRRALIGLTLCVYLCFIVIVLQPFDTSQFDAEYKTLLLSGYGIFAGLVFILLGRFENGWYRRTGKVWTVKREILSTLLYLFVSGSVLYAYNRTIVNYFREYTFWTYLRFMSVTVTCMVPVFVPPMIYLRQKLGEKIVPLAESSMILIGENKHEVLKLEKADLLFVKAVENYVEICFIDEYRKVISLTFRQTLSNVYEQLPFLERCHRSYLVNAGNIREITGNSQGAKISFMTSDKEIPLSKTYYKQVKADFDSVQSILNKEVPGRNILYN